MELFGFGPHLMIDGYNADPVRLGDIALIRDFLDRLPNEMEMTKVMPPHVLSYDDSGNIGVTGVVLIAESHIAIHTFPQKGFLSVDIFSCKEFDMEKALNKLIEVFKIEHHETRLIGRGKEFPRDIKATEKILLGEREYLEARIS